MKKDKLLSYVDKKVKLILFNGRVLEGILCYDSYLYGRKNMFSIGNYGFKCSYVTKVKEVWWYEKRKANGICR